MFCPLRALFRYIFTSRRNSVLEYLTPFIFFFFSIRHKQFSKSIQFNRYASRATKFQYRFAFNFPQSSEVTVVELYALKPYVDGLFCKESRWSHDVSEIIYFEQLGRLRELFPERGGGGCGWVNQSGSGPSDLFDNDSLGSSLNFKHFRLSYLLGFLVFFFFFVVSQRNF